MYMFHKVIVFFYNTCVLLVLISRTGNFYKGLFTIYEKSRKICLKVN